MAEKTRPFSIYLLRSGYDETNGLIDDHDLDPIDDATQLPAGSTLYILDADPKQPWWKAYFGIQQDILQESKGALLFVKTAERCFALSFGQVHHNLRDEAYEYDFGLRVTLNAVIPGELRSADMVEPGPARRKRTQVPASSDLTYLDFDANSEIIKSLTGRIKTEYKELFSSASGSSSLKVSQKIPANELTERCESLLNLYNLTDYKDNFPNIDNITPIRNPDDIQNLDDALIASMRSNDGRTVLSIPDIIDYRDSTSCMFQGSSTQSDIYPDITIEKFFEYVGQSTLNDISVDDLKRKYRLILTDNDGVIHKSYSLYRSLIFDHEIANESSMYHLCEGAWYKVNKEFADRIRTFIDSKCEDTDLEPYHHDEESNGNFVYSEAAYNKAMSETIPGLLCLDQTDISPSGSTAIEPCDLYISREDSTATSGFRASLYHIKISTRSAHLSHLFNQGLNSVTLLGLERDTSLAKMTKLLADRIDHSSIDQYTSPLEQSDYKVIFGIITHKPAGQKSGNLPLFSKLSLMRTMQELDLRRIPSALTFIDDQSPPKGGHSKYRHYLVEVRGENNKHIVCPVAGQELDPNAVVSRCPKELRASDIGSRFMMAIKVNANGSYSSSHHWPYTPVT